MSFVVGILTFFLIVNCALLILLVLIQLPKKDAGAGMAFGAGTADALFGAGSGNALTKITKWAAGILLVLCWGLGHVEASAHKSDNGEAFVKSVAAGQSQTPVTAPATHTMSPAPGTFTTTPVTTSNSPAAGSK